MTCRRVGPFYALAMSNSLGGSAACAGLVDETGNTFGLEAAEIEPIVRTGLPKAERDFIVGFRCARVP